MFPIHVAAINQKHYLFLRKLEDTNFQWFKTNSPFKTEIETPVVSNSIALAISEGYKYWKNNAFRLIHCGFRYTLPERDEVGSNALFLQMAFSYNSFNGRYFDEELGHLCYVDFASQEALEIWRKIR